MQQTAEKCLLSTRHEENETQSLCRRHKMLNSLKKINRKEGFLLFQRSRRGNRAGINGES